MQTSAASETDDRIQEKQKEIQTSLLEIDLDEGNPLVEAQTAVESSIFDCSLAIKKCLHSKPDGSPSSTADVAGVKLPKLEVPTFDWDILRSGNSFVCQYTVGPTLTYTEKLDYLQNSLKDGAAERNIESLTKSSELYEEAVKCLKSWYDWPRLIHQTHVHKIFDAPSLKDGNRRELHTLHDVIVQHLCALKAFGHEPSNYS